MLEVRGDLDFRQETLGPHDRCQFRLQHLEGYVAVVLQILGQIHRSHPAFTEFGLDAVATF